MESHRRGQDTLLPSQSRIFFDESTNVADTWAIEKLANAARQLLPPDPSYHIFIKLDHFMGSHLYFVVTLACTPNMPLRVWKTTVIDEDTDPQFECLSEKE